MGRGSNRRSLKMKRRNSWRRHKARLNRKIEEGKASGGQSKVARPAGDAAASVTRRANEE